MTGVVNMSIQTLLISNSAVSLGILCIYQLCLMAIAVILDKFNVTLKFW